MSTDTLLSHCAVMCGRVLILHAILTVPHTAVNTQDRKRNIPLHEAIQERHVEFIRELLAYPYIDVNRKDNRNDPPLSNAH